ncbi:MAG: hypothetical protein ACO3K7_03420 [Candidatus Marinamargulisbacteria bacterium]
MHWFFIFIFSLGVFAGDYSAREWYLNKNYDAAKQMYQDQLETAPSNFAYHYNIGAVYYRLNDLLMAKLYFLKALKFRPQHRETRQNLDLVNGGFVDDILFFDSYWPSILGLRLNVILGVMLILTMPFMIGIFWGRGLSSGLWVRRGLAVGALAWFGGMTCITILMMNTPDYGLVIVKKSPIYSGPSQTQSTLFYVHRGAEFKYLRSSLNWHHIQFSNGLKGWIPANEVLAI